MKLLVSFLLGVFCVFQCGVCLAAETIVEPGVNTLATAIANAEEGDTLILKDGVYSLSYNYSYSYYAYQFSKKLTIRAESKYTNAQIGVSHTGAYFDMQNEIVVQGVTFLSGVTGSLFSLIECNFNLTTSSTPVYSSTNVILIGNTFQPAAISLNASVQLSGNENVVAGNNFNNAYLTSSAKVNWVIGNSFTATEAIDTMINVGATGGYNLVAGNRISINYTDSNVFISPIRGGSYNSLISGNSIYLNITDDSRNYGISAGSSTGTAHIVNNVIYRTGNAGGDTQAAIRNPGLGTVAGNIIVGHNFTTMIDAPYANVSDNLCHSNQDLCGTQDGVLVADPQFADLQTFALATGSPGIDAGPVDPMLADLDRSRNDMGVYGGPWSIGQYDLQRDTGRTAPFVFPLFEAPISAPYGQLKVRALGAARLQ